jgi:flagellar basal-body rod protein FlgG
MSMRSLDIAATGVLAQELFVDVISQNLANINTTAYKLQRPGFQDLIYEDLRRMGTNSSDNGTIVPTGIQLGSGVKTAAIYRNNTEGPLQSTSGTLDLAVQGNGYFQIQMPDGTIAYTRDGSFQLSSTGQIVTADGYPLLPNITIPQGATSISIEQTGDVFVQLQGQTNPQQVGTIQLANFLNENGLSAIGNNLFDQTFASGPPTLANPGSEGIGNVLQGYLESSNVDPTTEITNLIRAQRAYEFNTKVITKDDEMLSDLYQSIT